jgi:hypothetical protein
MCSTISQRCAVPYHRDVQYHITEMCSTISQRCAVPYHRDMQYHITEMCSTISQRYAVPYHKDVQYHYTQTTKVVALTLKIAFAAQLELYPAFNSLNAGIVGRNHTWVAFIVFVFSCVGKPNSRRRSLTYVSSICTFRS